MKTKYDSKGSNYVRLHSNKFNNQISNFSLSSEAWLLIGPEFRIKE